MKVVTTPVTPKNPFALIGQPAFEAPPHRVEREVFGVRASVLSLPHRTSRHGMPRQDRPPFQANHADRIIATEAVWTGPGVAMTGNRFPFSAQQVILWATERRREPTRSMLEIAFRIEADVDGTSMVNSIGAAGSVTRSHVHVIGESPSFLRELPARGIEPESVFLTEEQASGCEVICLDAPFPGVAIGLRGSVEARAETMHHLLECRTAQAFNLISNGGISWLVPRSAVEITAPHFPQALGSAEISGLWCVNDPEVFARLDGPGMEAALAMGCVPRLT